MTGDNAPVRIQEEITLYAVFNSLGLSTGLPTAAELDQLKNVTPKKRRALPAPAAPETTAMERAG